MCSQSGGGDDLLWLEDCSKKFGGVGLKGQAKTVTSANVEGVIPINTRLEQGIFTAGPRFQPRRYQEELYLKSLEENVIIYLGTGLGKTFITVLTLCSPQYDSFIRAGKKVVFLAPTQDLVKQQAEYIYTKVPYRVRVYCGQTAYLGTHIDHWDEAAWRTQLLEVDILFMTPQIFCSAISTGLLKWEQFSLVIFDEAHHAATSSKERSGKKQGTPYSQTLMHFRTFCSHSANKPRFIGLTASLINTLPKDIESIRSGIKDLELKLFARCVTDITAIETKPKVVIYKFNKPGIGKHNDIVINTLEICHQQLSFALEESKRNRISQVGPTTDEERDVLCYLNRLRLAAHGFSIKPGSFHKIIRQLIAIRINSGLWTFANICVNLYQAVAKHLKSPLATDEIKTMYTEFARMLQALSTMVGQFLGPNPEDYLLSHSQPKLLCLLQLLRQEYIRIVSGTSEKSTFSCIVFVKSRVEVLAICGWLQQVSSSISEFDFIKADYAIGLAATQTSKWACITKRKSTEQMAMLAKFRRGDLNVIVTTSVLEEGIDLPVCSTVIRYDPAETFRVYVQSRGRARQEASSFVAMCEAPAEDDTRDKLTKFNDLEDRVKELLSENNLSVLPSRTGSTNAHAIKNEAGLEDVGPEDVFVDRERGIRIGVGMAKIILHMYCNRLIGQSPFSNGLLFERSETADKLIETTLFFPAGCPIKIGIKGNARKTVDLADASACVAAYRALYEAKELDEHGVPTRFTEEHIDLLLEKYGMRPNITPLDKIFEGDVTMNNNTPVHAFPWKLFHLKTSIAQAYHRREYKLYSISFVAAGDDCVRKDTREFMEKKTLGLIVDSHHDHSAWPKKLYSHYGEYDVVYKLIDKLVRIDEYNLHRDYSDYTHKIITSYWPLDRIRKDDLRNKLQFYIVPLDSRDLIKPLTVRNCLFVRTTPGASFRPYDLVRLRSIYRLLPADFSKSFIVVQVHWDMDIYSYNLESKHNERFIDQARRHYGPTNFHPQKDRPIVEVRPVSQEVARTSQGKKVDVDRVTKSILIPEQFLEVYEGDIPTAFQAYNLPEIVYKIYLSTLAGELNQCFERETDEQRAHCIRPLDISEYEQAWVASDDDEEDANDDCAEGVAREIAEQNLHESQTVTDDMEVDQDGEPVDMERPRADDQEEIEEDIHGNIDDDHCLIGESSDTSADEDDDQFKSNDNYRQTISKQKFYLTDRNSRDLEKWDMSQYSVPNLKALHIEIKSFEAPQKYLNTNPRLPEDHTWVYPTIGAAGNIGAALARFKTGIVGLGDILSEDQVFDRPGKVVDLAIKPPIILDRARRPSRPVPFEFDLTRSLTQKRSGEPDNLEMMENIGDSYLKYCVTVQLFRRVHRDEGQLTNARSRLVSNKHFSFLAKKKQLGCYAIGRKFDMDVINSALGGRITYKNKLRLKDLADLLEACVGAYLLYRGEYEAIMAIKWFGINIFDQDSFSELHKDAVVFTKPESAIVDQDPEAVELMKSSKKKLERFEDIIKYQFADKSYLVQAFTHASAVLRCTESYERLEFLGDAILDYLVTMTLERTGLYTTPGQITSSRSALVNNCTFAKLAIKYKFDIFLQHTNQELFDELGKVNEYAKLDPDLEFIEQFQFDRISKVLGDLFESVAGAIYIDSGCSLDAVYKIYYPMMKENIDNEVENPTKNIVTQLFEKFAGRDRIVITYSKVQLDNAAENCQTRASCSIHNFKTFHAEGLTKSQAKKRVAAEVMANLPSEEEQKQLDEEYARILAAKDAAERASRVQARGRGRARGGGGRGRQGARGGNHRGRGYQSRVDQQPYPLRLSDCYGRGQRR